MHKTKLSPSAEGLGSLDLLRPKRRKSILLAEFMREDFPDEAPLLGQVITHGSTGKPLCVRSKFARKTN